MHSLEEDYRRAFNIGVDALQFSRDGDIFVIQATTVSPDLSNIPLER